MAAFAASLRLSQTNATNSDGASQALQGTHAVEITYTREITPVLPFAAVLAGRVLALLGRQRCHAYQRGAGQGQVTRLGRPDPACHQAAGEGGMV